MDFKLINAASAKSGTTINVEGIPCIVKSNDISKTGVLAKLVAYEQIRSQEEADIYSASMGAGRI